MKILAAFTLVVTIAAGGLFTAPALGKEIPEVTGDCRNAVVTRFPRTGTEVSRWQLCWEEGRGTGPVIYKVFFRPSPSAKLIEVFNDARLGEIFVPYHAGEPRYFDVSDYGFPMIPLSQKDCPRSPQRRLLGAGRLMCQEFRDRGIAWKSDELVRRGEEMVLWGVIDAGNYNYIVEWTFRDEGSILARVGSTGPKLHGPDDEEGHMHTFTWRLDFDIAGPGRDQVLINRHLETGARAKDKEQLVTKEAGFVWNPFEFNAISITDTQTVNANQRRMSYKLIPARTGNARHKESYTKKDFWVTTFKATEVSPVDINRYVNNQNVANTDIVLWYTASAHHTDNMRDEDRQTVPVIWTGFELQPQNIFNGTPFFPQHLIVPEHNDGPFFDEVL